MDVGTNLVLSSCPVWNWHYFNQVYFFCNVYTPGVYLIPFSQAFILICPTKLAGQWFPMDKRLLANSIASLANPLGMMLAAVLAPILVDGPEDIKYAQIYFGIPSVVAAVMSFFINSEGVYPSVPELPLKERLKILFGRYSLNVKIITNNKSHNNIIHVPCLYSNTNIYMASFGCI